LKEFFQQGIHLYIPLNNKDIEEGEEDEDDPKGDEFPFRKGCVKMAANKTAGKGKGPESGASGSQLGNAGTEDVEIANLSEQEITRYLTAQQRLERLRKLIEEEQKIAKEFEEKKESIRETIMKEISEKYGLNEEDIKTAFSEINNKSAKIFYIINAIENEGEKALEREDIKEMAEIIRKIRIAETMNMEDVKKISVICEDARRYMEEKEAEEGKAEIHHTGRMSKESIKLLKYVKEQGGRVTWKEFREYGKETLGLSTDTLNKRRWGLIDKGYIRREGRDIVITKKGLGRLEEEGC